jgi:hypothetical protein
LNAELNELDDWAELSASTDFPQQRATGKAGLETARSHEEIVRRAYEAYNDRQIDTGVALMDAEVDWPNVAEGGFIHGREQVRQHWIEQFRRADPRVEVDEIRQKRDGQVEVRVRQTLRGRDGQDLPGERAIHVVTMAGDRIRRMEVRR